MSGPLARFQADFTAALFAASADGLTASGAADTAVGALARQPAFAVYRNTVMKGCIDALEANYPSVARLVGPAWFGAAAAAFVREQPPRDGRLLVYGDGFAGFLAAADAARERPWLADVARVDRFWTEAHIAADAEAASGAALAAMAPDALGALRLRPHPSARWRWFADAPVASIWRRAREGNDNADDDTPGPPWHGEGALLVRLDDVVGASVVGRADCAFLDACASGAALARAAAEALVADERADIAAVLARLLRAGALAAPPRPDPEPS